MAKFVVVDRTSGQHSVEADNFYIGSVDTLRGPANEGALTLIRNVPASSSPQTVAVFRDWASIELVEETPNG